MRILGFTERNAGKLLILGVVGLGFELGMMFLFAFRVITLPTLSHIPGLTSPPAIQDYVLALTLVILAMLPRALIYGGLAGGVIGYILRYTRTQQH